MPTSVTYDDLILALAREAYSGEHPIDLDTTGVGAQGGTTAIFGDLAFGAAGSTTSAYHDTYLYLRRFSGLATAGGASTITLRTAFGTPAAANVLANFIIKITAGTSSGDERTIASNTVGAGAGAPPVVTVTSAWTATPDTTSFYEIYPSGSAADTRIVRDSKSITTAPFTVATGAITLAPAFAGAGGVALMAGIGTDFLFCKEHPSLLRTSINRVLRNMRYPAYLPVTLVTDGDMEDTGVTNWAAVGSPTTREKAATTASGLPFGRQCLHIAGGDAAGATSNAVSVDEAENLYIAVPIDLVSGSADVILYDSTNSTALKTVNVTELGPCMVYFQQAPGSTTANVRIRLLGSEASSEFYAGPVFLWSGQRTRYPADTSSLERARDPKRAFVLRCGQSVETDVYHIGELAETTFGIERDDRANLINVTVPVPYYPMLLQVHRRYPELAYDADTTYAAKDIVVQGAMYHIERHRAARLESSNPLLAARHDGRAREYATTYSRMLEGTGISLVEILDQRDRQPVRFGG